MAMKFVMSQPALAPLFVAVGLGVLGSLTFATHYLSSNPDVVIRKKRDGNWDGPWNSVPQNKNTKLFSFNKDVWQSRATLPDPRAAFLDDATADRVKVAKAKAIAKSKEAKEETIGH